MWLLDQWAERHIIHAQRKGEFDNLSGQGEPLTLDDDSCVPEELRVGFRLLKNAGCLPPEIELRKDAIALSDLLKGIREDDERYQELSRRLVLLEMKLQQAGLNTDFLHGVTRTNCYTKLRGSRDVQNWRAGETGGGDT